MPPAATPPETTATPVPFIRKPKRRRHPLSSGGATGLIIVSVVVAAAALATIVAPHEFAAQDLINRFQPPVWSGGSQLYLLGTDGLGRDILSRLLVGTRISLAIGVLTVLLAGSSGLLLGLVAGYFGGRAESVIMRAADIQLSVPFLVVAIALVSVFGPGLEKMILILVLFGWVDYCRVVRAEVLSLKSREFVDAARVIGSSNARILFAHILPNVTSSIIVVATLQVARMILAEASLSFLGLGVQPPNPAWGAMVAEGREVITVAWWVSTLPGLAILVTVLGINMVGDWMRDVLDPTLRIT